MSLRIPETDTLAVNGATLSVGIYEPDGPTRGMLGLFSPGWSATWQDYAPLLSPLADAGYRVVAVNPRGHGGSSGILDAGSCIDDLTEAYRKYGAERNILLGHSLSSISLGVAMRARNAGIPAPDGILLAEPFINIDYLPLWMRIGIHASAGLQHIYDPHLQNTARRAAVSRNLGLNMNHFFANTAALRTLDGTQYRTDIPVLYFLADKDATLGVRDPRIMARYKAVLDGLGPNVEDASDLVAGLNHCWNIPRRREQYTPFLKDEQGKEEQKGKILDRIIDFCEKAER